MASMPSYDMGTLSRRWIAEMDVRRSYISDMRYRVRDEEKGQLKEHEAIFRRLVRDKQDELFARADAALRHSIQNPAWAPQEFIISKHAFWKLARASLTCDVIWRVALSMQPRQRISTEMRAPIRGAWEIGKL